MMTIPCGQFGHGGQAGTVDQQNRQGPGQYHHGARHQPACHGREAPVTAGWKRS